MSSNSFDNISLFLSLTHTHRKITLHMTSHEWFTKLMHLKQIQTHLKLKGMFAW